MNSTGSGLGALRPGDHLCFPYENEHDLRSALVTFFREGLARHERCLFIGSPAEHAMLLTALREVDVPAEAALARGALVLATQRETYLRTGRFDSDDALAMIDQHITAALEAGFVGLRASGGPSGAVPDDLWTQIVSYERYLDELVARRPFVGLCRFHAAHVRAARVQEVMRTHPLALLRGQVRENPLYARPADAVPIDKRTRIDLHLHRLRSYQPWRSRVDAATEARHRAVWAAFDEACDGARLSGRPVKIVVRYGDGRATLALHEEGRSKAPLSPEYTIELPSSPVRPRD